MIIDKLCSIWFVITTDFDSQWALVIFAMTSSVISWLSYKYNKKVSGRAMMPLLNCKKGLVTEENGKRKLRIKIVNVGLGPALILGWRLSYGERFTTHNNNSEYFDLRGFGKYFLCQESINDLVCSGSAKPMMPKAVLGKEEDWEILSFELNMRKDLRTVELNRKIEGIRVYIEFESLAGKKKIMSV